MDRGTPPYYSFSKNPITTTASGSRLGRDVAPALTDRKIRRTHALGGDPVQNQAERPEQPVLKVPAVCLHHLSYR